jgi:long-subunit acyl-CoA synthetase (AMP-forming)
LRNQHLSLSYWNNAEATRVSIDAARWMHTGDLEVMDEEGYVNMVYRHDNASAEQKITDSAEIVRIRL